MCERERERMRERQRETSRDIRQKRSHTKEELERVW